MKTANKKVTLKHRTTYSKMVKVRAADIKQEILNVINTVKGDLNCAAFTTDMWTSDADELDHPLHRQKLAATQVICPDFKIKELWNCEFDIFVDHLGKLSFTF